MKPRTRYGILDGILDDIIRWQWDKPSKNYRYVVGRLTGVILNLRCFDDQPQIRMELR